MDGEVGHGGGGRHGVEVARESGNATVIGGILGYCMRIFRYSA